MAFGRMYSGGARGWATHVTGVALVWRLERRAATHKALPASLATVTPPASTSLSLGADLAGSTLAAQNLLDDMPTVFQRRACLATHESKLRVFGPFAQADERFVAALSTKLRPEVYLPEAFIQVTGEVYTCAYFVSKGIVQITWPADKPDSVNELLIDDHFGELSLFLNKKLTYTARSVSEPHASTSPTHSPLASPSTACHPVSSL